MLAKGIINNKQAATMADKTQQSQWLRTSHKGQLATMALKLLKPEDIKAATMAKKNKQPQWLK